MILSEVNFLNITKSNLCDRMKCPKVSRLLENKTELRIACVCACVYLHMGVWLD